MKIEVGKIYKDGWGSEFTIQGIVPANPEWVWSLQGFWFEAATGCRLTYFRDTGHAVLPAPSMFQLCEEVPK